MSQDFHPQGIFSFTPPPINAPDDSSQIRIREDNNSNHKLRLQGLAHAPEGASASGMHPAVYETAGMLSEMLNFGGGHGGGGGVNAAGMQFFLTDPQPRSPSPPPLTHVLLPTQQHEFMNWVDPEGGRGGGGVEGRGLSLSLSSPLEAAKAEEEMRMGGGGGGMMFFGNHGQNQHVMHLQGYGIGHPSSGHFGFGSALAAPASSLGAVNSLRNSKFVKPAQELLEEFCSVGRGNLKKSKFSRNNSINSTTSSGGGAGPSSSNSAKDSPALSPSDRMEHQRRKVKLLTMLDEMERRYSQYCEQMQMVVNSYDVVMGYGAAIPYTALAQKAMSRHFRCLKDAIQAQLKHSCELLGDKDVSTSTGLTKGETPRLKILEQSLRQQRAFHQMGMMEQEAWRPQRGLPERSVNILRAWLFEHFLHPYPSDADKHLLARQTGLSRNQVSNWFINARVRLWKPMVEDMYQQESKDGAGDGQRRQQDQEDVDDDDDDDGDDDEEDGGKRSSSGRDTVANSNAQTSMSAATSTTPPKRSLINAPDTDASYFAINGASLLPAPAEFAGAWPLAADDGVAGPTMLGFGASTAAAAAGDVSLTLGLRHSAAGGGQPEKSGFSFRDFGS